MGFFKFLSDVFGRVISNLLVFALTAVAVLLIIRYMTGINIFGFFF